MAGTRSLPELRARLRLDTAQVKRDVAEVAAATEALGKAGESAGVKSAAAMTSFSKALETAQRKTVEQLALMSKLGAEATKIGRSAGGELTGGGGIFGALGSLGGNLPVIGLVTGAIGGLLAGMEELTRRTAAYSTEVLRNSELLGLDSTQYQVLAQASEKLGISQEDLTLKLGRFQKNLESGAPTLKVLGLDLKSIGITSGDLGTAITQLSTYLSSNTDITQRNAVAQALLGRGSLQLTEILAKGPQFLADYQAHLERFGLILDKTTLQQGALSNAVSSTFHDALKGLEFQIGTQLESAFIGLESTAIQALGGSKEAFRKIGEVIASVIGFITSFLNGLFGLNINLSTLSQSADKAATDLNAMGAGANAAAAGTDALGTGAGKAGDALAGLREQTKDQTAALDALIKAEQEQTKSAIAGVDDQKKAVQDLSTTQIAAIDDQIKAQRDYETSLNDQWRMQQLLQQQQDEAGTSLLAQLQAQLDMVNDVTDSRRRSGESLIDYERRLETKKLQDAIKNEQNRRAGEKTNHEIFLEQVKEQVQAKVSQFEEEKKNLQESTRLQLAALDEQRQAYGDTSAKIIQGYQDQKTTLQQTLSDAQQKTASTSAAMTSDMAGAAASSQAGALQTGAVFDSVFKQIGDKSSETARKMGDDIRGVFQHPEAINGLVSSYMTALMSTMGHAALAGFQSLSLPEQLLVSSTVGGMLGGPLGMAVADAVVAGLALVGAVGGMIHPKPVGAGGDLAYDVNGKPISGTDANGMFTPDSPSLPPFSTAGQSGTQGIHAPYDSTAFGASPGGSAGGAGARPAGARALGGAVAMGQAYNILERNMPEIYSDGMGGVMMIPKRSGTVTPAGGGGTKIDVHFHAPVADEYVALRVVDRLDREWRRRASTFAGGAG